MRISTKSRYGLKAMIELAKYYEENGVLALSTVAANTELSESYLEQLFIPLRKNGLVVSSRGAMGGYSLARSPKEISIGDIMRALEDGLVLVDCLSESKAPCVNQCNCKTYGIWKKLSDGINSQLDLMKLSDCLEE